MDRKVKNQLYGLCYSIEILIKNNIKDEHSLVMQKILMDLFSSVLSYQINHKKGN